MSLLNQLEQKKKENKKSLAVLIDPDKIEEVSELLQFVRLCTENKVDYIFVGGSLITTDNFSKVISLVKAHTQIPVLIFPGNNIQIDANADAILLLSLISGRNPDFLIGQHVLAAPILKKSNLEIIPMGYMLVNSGAPTSASYMSNTTPIPADKPTIAACTAMAGEMLGLRTVYMDAGSGAEQPIPQKIIRKVARSISLPLVIGGGLNSISRINLALEAGADLVVIGNALEKDQSLLIEASEKIHSLNASLDVHQ